MEELEELGGTPHGGLPHSREAEEACVGAVLINPEVYYDLAQFLQAGDFYIHRLRFIWEAYVRLHKRKLPVDILTVSEELDDMGRLGEIGGQAFLTALLNQVPTTLHAEAYGKIVEATSIRRKLLAACNSIATMAYDESEELEKITGDAMTALAEAVNQVGSGNMLPLRDVISRVYDQVDRLSRLPADVLPGVPTGFPDLDRMFGGGLQKGRMYTIGGRPGQGKTAFALSVAHNASYKHGKRGAFFSLEMPAEEVVTRLLSMSSGIDGQKIQTGKISSDEWSVFCQSVEDGNAVPIYIDDTPGLTPLQILARCKRMAAEIGLDYVVIDYLGLMNSPKNYENRVQEVSYLSRMTKQIARELKVPVLVPHQLSRQTEQRENKEPEMSDLRDSGTIEQDSDIVMLIWQDPDPQSANITHMKIPKQRGGPTGQVDFVFRRPLTKFESVTRRQL